MCESLFAHVTDLEVSMIKVGAVVVSNMKTAAHHIVAAGEAYFYAAEARKILIKFGVHIDEAANGVILPTVSCDLVCNHRVIHTYKYYANLYNALIDAKSRAQVIEALNTIRTRLLNGDTSVYLELDNPAMKL